MFQSIIKNCIS